MSETDVVWQNGENGPEQIASPRVSRHRKPLHTATKYRSHNVTRWHTPCIIEWHESLMTGDHETGETT
jgi:hypothetical protein